MYRNFLFYPSPSPYPLPPGERQTYWNKKEIPSPLRGEGEGGGVNNLNPETVLLDCVTGSLGKSAFWKLPGSDEMIKWFDQFRPIHSTSEILCQQKKNDRMQSKPKRRLGIRIGQVCHSRETCPREGGEPVGAVREPPLHLFALTHFGHQIAKEIHRHLRKLRIVDVEVHFLE